MGNKLVQIGGSFAPPLTDEKLARYEELAAGASERVREGMQSLLKMCKAWWELPDSAQEGQPHASGRGLIVPMEKAHVEELWDLVPWKDELDVIAAHFDGISPTDEKELRDAAHHLLWFGYELTQDREPITNDKL